jgi:hypothetical protein
MLLPLVGMEEDAERADALENLKGAHTHTHTHTHTHIHSQV